MSVIRTELAKSVTTTNATATTIASVEIAELENKLIIANVIGQKSDGTAGAWVIKSAAYRRAAAGNITLIGSVNGTTQEDSGGTPAINLTINTGVTPQRVDVEVTGISAETWNWRAWVQVVQQ